MGRLIRRFLNGLVYVAVLAGGVVVLAHPQAGAVAPLGTASRPSLSFEWTPALARRSPGCQGHVGGVASAFVVERESGQVERLPFDLVWKWTHDKTGNFPSLWALGQCR